jgi:Na+-translocating ferredoxin:NAD+ oxidoreductase RnfG subunit
MLTEPLIIILITSITGLLMKLISMCYKSKCASIDCYGVHILRDVVIEEDYDEQQLKEMKKTDSVII